MTYAKYNSQQRSRGRRATALVLVVVLLALLAILGTTFVITSRIERVAAGNQVNAGGIDQGTDSTVDVIKSTLAEDLWGKSENCTDVTNPARNNHLNLLGIPDNATRVSTWTNPDNLTNEPWDTPVTYGQSVFYYDNGTAFVFYYDNGTILTSYRPNVDGDPWLASTERDNTTGNWFQVSNLTSLQNDNASDNYSGGIPVTALEADADGDGVADAHWKQLPVVQGNVHYRTAVRIVDTCGMLNLNTSWRWPTDYAADNISFPGNVLSGVNLYDNNTFPEFGDLPGRSRLGGTLDNLMNFQDNFTFRIENPNWAQLPNFYPLDMSDEMYLRYRWSDNSSRDNNTLRSYFYANLPAASRHWLTTYSFTRNIRRDSIVSPGGDAKFPAVYNLQDTVRELVNVFRNPSGYTLQDPQRLRMFVQCVRNAFTYDNTSGSYADNISDPVYHTWQYLTNLVAYLDPGIDNVTFVNADNSTGLADVLGLAPVNTTLTFDGATTRLFGVKQHAPITELQITCTGYTTDNVTDNFTYTVSAEVGNPWHQAIHCPDIVQIEVRRSDNATVLWEDNISTLSGRTLAAPTAPDNFTFTFDTATATHLLSRPHDNSTTLPHVILIASSYFSGVPESTFHTQDITLPEEVNHAASAQRETSTSWWKSLADNSTIVYIPPGNASLGLPNDNISVGVTSGFSAVITLPGLSDTYHDPATQRYWDNTTPTRPFALLRNLSDLAAVPYVGYSRNMGVQEGIEQFLTRPDGRIHFDFREGGVDNATSHGKGGIFRDRLCSAFRLLDRVDNSTPLSTGFLDRMRLPGLINVNTAPREVLMTLHAVVDNATAQSIIDHRPYRSIGEVLEKNAAIFIPGSGHDFFIQGLGDNTTSDYDVVDKSAKWSRISNLITTRSDTFVAYILIQGLDGNTLVSQRREIVLFDRSWCNQPPLIWNDNTKTPANRWVPNPNYVAPKVVARQVVE